MHFLNNIQLRENMNNHRYRFFLIMLAFVNTIVSVVALHLPSKPNYFVVLSFSVFIAALAYFGCRATVQESMAQIQNQVSQSNLKQPENIMTMCIEGYRSWYSNMMYAFFCFQLLTMYFFHFAKNY